MCPCQANVYLRPLAKVVVAKAWFRRKVVSQKQMFRVGDSVRIKSGPFASFTGTVIGVNQAMSLLKVAVTILGHQKPLRLRFSEVEKVPGI
jgi:transcriptional antiterminator NusG